MNILLLGGGGREHALAWAIAQNPKCDRLITAPGNAGIAELAECRPLDICDGAAVVGLAREVSAGLVVIGPEAPLVAGVADILRETGIPVFGPSAAAARLEASKAFTKEVCAAAGVPTAAHVHLSDAGAAHAHIDASPVPIVVKADGLAAGKGVTVAATRDEAHAALDTIFAEPGATVVIEEMLSGEEASFFVLCDGEVAVPFGTAQDHKRAFDGDEGPNTGGMGAYSPAPILTDAVADLTMQTIIRPTLSEMARRGTPYTGILYAGLMIDEGQPRLVEYNVRFGDPEAQVLMMRLGAQALDGIEACATGRLSSVRPQWAADHALCVVMATQGYPGAVERGSVIEGLDAAERPGVRVFHAGTGKRQGHVTAEGGRVLGVTARAETLLAARERAYEAVDRIEWPEGFCRQDIGWRALDRVS